MKHAMVDRRPVVLTPGDVKKITAEIAQQRDAMKRAAEAVRRALSLSESPLQASELEFALDTLEAVNAH